MSIAVAPVMQVLSIARATTAAWLVGAAGLGQDAGRLGHSRNVVRRRFMRYQNAWRIAINCIGAAEHWLAGDDVTVKKKRSAETELLMPGGCCRPASCSWKRRRSSAVAVSGERPMKAANLFTQRM